VACALKWTVCPAVWMPRGGAAGVLRFLRLLSRIASIFSVSKATAFLSPLPSRCRRLLQGLADVVLCIPLCRPGDVVYGGEGALGQPVEAVKVLLYILVSYQIWSNTLMMKQKKKGSRRHDHKEGGNHADHWLKLPIFPFESAMAVPSNPGHK